MAEQLVFAKGQAPDATRTVVVAGINDLQSQSENEIESGIIYLTAWLLLMV